MSEKKQIIVWKDKHGSFIYAAETEMEKAYAYEHIFNSMLNLGYYRDMDSAPEDIKNWQEQLKQLESLKEELANDKVFPSLREEAEKQVEGISQIKRMICYKTRELRLFNSAKEGNVKSKRDFIRDRSEYEYERVSFDTLICPSIEK